MKPLPVTWPPPGDYILAVSGGADSMTLLEIFSHNAKRRGLNLIVAHFDHGLREDSAADAQFVAAVAEKYGLQHLEQSAKLISASEASARSARHAWLEDVRVTTGSRAVITAHHRDDLLETSLLNLARGSGRLGLAPMPEGTHIIRPLLAATRTELRNYAADHQIAWREDESNADISNPRNFLRHRLLPRATPQWQAAYLALLSELTQLNTEIAQSISVILETCRADDTKFIFNNELLRHRTDLEINELLLGACRDLRPGIQLDRPLIISATHFMRTAAPRKQRPLRQGLVLYREKDHISLTTKQPD